MVLGGCWVRYICMEIVVGGAAFRATAGRSARETRLNRCYCMSIIYSRSILRLVGRLGVYELVGRRNFTGAHMVAVVEFKSRDPERFASRYISVYGQTPAQNET